MAQTPNPYGFKLIYAKESNLSAGLQQFPIQNTYPDPIFSGDPVTFFSKANEQSKGAIGKVLDPTTISDADMPLVGIFGGCTYQMKRTGQQSLQRSSMWPGITDTANSQPGVATVNDHPFMIWQVQTNGVFQPADIAGKNTPIGLNFNFDYGLNGGDVATGQSRARLVVNVAAAAHIGAFFKIIGLAPIQNNAWNDPYVDVYVAFNNHYLKPGTTSFAPA